MNKSKLRMLAVVVAIAAASQTIYASMTTARGASQFTMSDVSQRTQELLAKKQTLEAQGERLTQVENLELLRGLKILSIQVKSKLGETSYESPGV